MCAQHALNTLLQGPYFTVVDLSQLAMQLDEEEAAVCILYSELYFQLLALSMCFHQASPNPDLCGVRVPLLIPLNFILTRPFLV